MTVELNHTIIPAKDKWQSAKFLADILNLEAGPEWGHFVPIRTANGVTLDFDTREDFRPQHFAFLISEAEVEVVMVRGVAVRRQHHREILAGAPRHIAQEAALRPRLVPVALDADRAAVSEAETGDVDRQPQCVHAEPAAAVDAAAGEAAAVIDADDPQPELLLRRRLHHLALELVEPARQGAAHHRRPAEVGRDAADPDRGI